MYGSSGPPGTSWWGHQAAISPPPKRCLALTFAFALFTLAWALQPQFTSL